MTKGGSPRGEYVRDTADVGMDHLVEQDDLMHDDALVEELLANGVDVQGDEFDEFEFADEEDDEFGPKTAADEESGHEAERDEGADEVGGLAEDEMSLSEGVRWEDESEADGDEEGEDYDPEGPDHEGESDPLFMSDEFGNESRRRGVFGKLREAGRQLTSVNVLMGMFIGIAIFVSITMFASGAWLMSKKIHRNVWHDGVASTASAATPSVETPNVATPGKLASSGEASAKSAVGDVALKSGRSVGDVAASAKSGRAVGDVAASVKSSPSVDVDAGQGEPSPHIPVPVTASKPVVDRSNVEEPPSGREAMVEPEVAAPGGAASAERVVGAEQRHVAAANGDPRDGVVKAYERAMQDGDRVVGSVPESGGPTPMAGPQQQNLNPSESSQLIALAKARIGKGDIPSGRLILERAAELRDSNAAFLLGETYDIVVLGGSDARSVLADPEQAELWYRKAAEYGSVEARRRLLRP